jgi:hypothetical protein
MDIPIIYRLYLKRLYDESFNGRIELKRAKRILTYYYRVPKNLVGNIFKEFDKLNWIEYENHRYIIILENLECEILYRHSSREPTTL